MFVNLAIPPREVAFASADHSHSAVISMARGVLELAPMRPLVLSAFVPSRPRSQTTQSDALAWILEAHVDAERQSMDEEALTSFRDRLAKAIKRCACNPTQIGSRGHVLDDLVEIYDTRVSPHGKGMLARMEVFERESTRAFDDLFRNDEEAPPDIVHVTCTGYVSPSAAQHLVAQRGWGKRTRVTHAYHMGCYAALPALRIAEGCLSSSTSAAPRVEIVHTEMCTLHLDPSRHELEQLVVQSLFADGSIRYSMTESESHGLRLLAAAEHIVPDSEASMRWVISEWGMRMTLARDVPEKVGAVLRSFVSELIVRAGLTMADLPKLQFAVHPGGPRIIDGVRVNLELTEHQVRFSREVLFDYGNMSSATLPHVWMRMLDSDDVARGTCIVSLAFGPGVTVSGAVFRKQ
jgi:predicted naringenin-chalcone synthase